MNRFTERAPETNVLGCLKFTIFSSLTTLQLRENYIVCLQDIQHLNANKLKKLDLRCNLITNIKPLRKTSFYELRELLISDNFVTNYSYLSEMDLSSAYLVVV